MAKIYWFLRWFVICELISKLIKRSQFNIFGLTIWVWKFILVVWVTAISYWSAKAHSLLIWKFENILPENISLHQIKNSFRPPLLPATWYNDLLYSLENAMPIFQNNSCEMMHLGRKPMISIIQHNRGEENELPPLDVRKVPLSLTPTQGPI